MRLQGSARRMALYSCSEDGTGIIICLDLPAISGIAGGNNIQTGDVTAIIAETQFVTSKNVNLKE